MRAVSVLLTLAGSLLLAAPVPALEITNVRPSALAIESQAGESVTVSFHLSEPAKAALFIYDGRDYRIRGVESEGILPAGDHDLAWDGRSDRGEFVPPEAYRFVIQAEAPDGRLVRYDLSDVTGGEMALEEPVVWDADEGLIRYSLSAAARIRIRLGLSDSGPLLTTLRDWVPRTPGPHAEAWDGRDASGVLDVSTHPNLEVVAETYSLSGNSILVLPLPDVPMWIPDLDGEAPRREHVRDRPFRMHDYARQAMENRRDFPIVLSLPTDLEEDDEGIPIVRSAVAVRLDVEPGRRTRVLDERFEGVFYLDGRFMFENEVGFLPMTWLWDPAGVNPGVHYLTANLRGYDGHFGLSTIKIRVKAPDPER